VSDVRQNVIACHMDELAYEPTWDLQRRIQAKLVADKRRDPPVLSDHVLLLCEHPPVFTLGKSGDAAHLLASDARLQAEGATFVQIDRGGDITYHGPGQVVGYPILDLDRFYTDIHRYLRDLEEVVIRTCSDYSLKAGRIEGRTGVWIEADDRGPERKICAMGIRCSRWVTMHGFALNVSTNLDHFGLIVPCGIRDRGVTSLQEELGISCPIPEVKRFLCNHFADVFGVRIANLGHREAERFLQTYFAEQMV
jgi:lipoyl(octanoyl) transferase